MPEEKVKEAHISRRQFLAGAGSLLAIGTVAPNIAVGAVEADVKRDSKPLEGVSSPGAIVHDPALCAGCGVCALMCAFLHEKEYGPDQAGNELIRDPLNAVYAFRVCEQCSAPACYQACPDKDRALRLDKETGITYVDPAHCQGCGACSEACPFSPARIRVHPQKKRAIKCDLCRNRAEGPICVEYCPMQALKKIPAGRQEKG